MHTAIVMLLTSETHEVEKIMIWVTWKNQYKAYIKGSDGFWKGKSNFKRYKLYRKCKHNATFLKNFACGALKYFPVFLISMMLPKFMQK